MTRTKLFDRLTTFGPQLLAATTKPGYPCCILATRTAIDVLKRFGIAAEPLTVIVEAYDGCQGWVFTPDDTIAMLMGLRALAERRH